MRILVVDVGSPRGLGLPRERKKEDDQEERGQRVLTQESSHCPIKPITIEAAKPAAITNQ